MAVTECVAVGGSGVLRPIPTLQVIRTEPIGYRAAPRKEASVGNRPSPARLFAPFRILERNLRPCHRPLVDDHLIGEDLAEVNLAEWLKMPLLTASSTGPFVLAIVGT